MVVGCVTVMNGQQNASPGFACMICDMPMSTSGLNALAQGDSLAFPCFLVVCTIRSLITSVMGVGASMVGTPLAK